MRRSYLALISALVVVVTLSSPLHAEKKRKASVLIRPDQSFEIPDAPQTYPTSKRGCANDVWGTAVATVLRAQEIELAPKDISVKLAGGDACLPALPEFDILRKSVEGDYPFGNGRRFRIRLELAVGAPTAADPLAVELYAKRPLIFVYQGRPLLLYGVTYDEHILNNLRKELWITELRLIDPAAAVGSDARIVKFKRDDPRLTAIEGVIKVVATPLVMGQLEPR